MQNRSIRVACCLVLASCSSSGDVGVDSGADSGSGVDAGGTDASGSDSGTSAEHLYIPDRNLGGLVRVFALPLTTSSVPLASIPAPYSDFVAVNATTLAVCDESNSIHAFTLPVSSSSTPFAVFPVSTLVHDLAFGPNGTLYETTPSMTVNMFAPPFSSSTTVSGTLTVPTLKSGGALAFDTTGALYVCDIMRTIFVINGSSVTTTAMAPTSSQDRAVVASATQLFVADLFGGVYVFDLPLTTASVPVATITSGINEFLATALDKAGNLYVGSVDPPSIAVYSPPFSDASAPVVTLPLAADAAFSSIAIGP